MTNKKTEATKAPAQRTDAAGHDAPETVTKLAEVQNPASVTEAQIAEISGDDGTDTAENSANADVADALRQDKAEAKTKGDEPRGYYHGHGGGAGEPG